MRLKIIILGYKKRQTCFIFTFETGLFIMTIEYRNAGKRFDKPILSAFANSNTHCFEFALYSWQWYRQIFFENLLSNRRFGVEIVCLTTISTIYNHYRQIHGKFKPFLYFFLHNNSRQSPPKKGNCRLFCLL